MTEVSVIVAAWRAAGMLERSVTSALAQEGVTVEVIVSDDASPDDTLAVAQALAARDGRVRAIASPVNGGPAAARNRALEIAQGEWIAVLDADDSFAPGRLATLRDMVRAKGADVALDNLREVDAGGAPLGDAPFLKGPAHAARRRLDITDYISGNTGRWGETSLGYLKPLFRRAFLERHGLRYDESLRNGEDYHLVLACLAAGAEAWLDPSPGYLYSRREGSVSHRMDPAHMAALRRADAAFLKRRGRDLPPEAVRLLHRRARLIADADAAEAAMRALKRGRPDVAAAALLRRPRAMPRMGRQIGEALAKRLRGRGGAAYSRP